MSALPNMSYTTAVSEPRKFPLSADLEVEVSDSFGVEILNAIQDLLEKLRGLLLSQRFFLCQEVEQLSSRHQLQDQDHVRLVFKDVMQGDDVAVLDLAQDVDLAFDLFAAHSPPAGRQPPLLDKLGCVLDACALLLALTNDGKLSAAERKDQRDVNAMFSYLML